MQLTPEEDAELDGLKARLDAGDLKRGSAEFGRMMALARRRRDAIAAAHAAAAALLPPPPPPPAPPVPLPDPAKFRARQDRDLRELLDLIRSEIAEALAGSLPAAEPAPYIDLSERPVEESPIPPPPSPAVVALEKMEDVRAKLDAVRGGGSEDDIAGIYPSWFEGEAQDGESVADRIARLSRKFRARVNVLTNKLLAGEITPEEEAERDSLMDQYNALAELGDRS